jgi:hypothetical protein
LQAGASRSAFNEVTDYGDGVVGHLLREVASERAAT